jgi:twitching motility two-component system response regulator PilH
MVRIHHNGNLRFRVGLTCVWGLISSLPAKAGVSRPRFKSQGVEAMAKKILVVDDEQDAVDFVSEVLEGEGYQVVTAPDGSKGLASMRSEKPDLVILDVQMPEMDGFEVFQEMKKDDALKAIPVVMLTGIREKVGMGFSADEMKDFMGEKPYDYIEKPIDPGKLRESVKKILPA